MPTFEGFVGFRTSGGNGKRRRFLSRSPARIALLALLLPACTASAETWRGLVVAPEHRCAPYQRSDYRYSQSVEPRIVAALGAVYGLIRGAASPTGGRPTSSTSSPCRRRTTAGYAPPTPERAGASPPTCST